VSFCCCVLRKCEPGGELTIARTSLLIVLIGLTVLLGCAKVRLPLCPNLAVLSYPGKPAGTVVNKYLAEQAKQRGITVTPLSPFTVELSGAKHRVQWFVKNYPFMMCSVGPDNSDISGQLYVTCMTQASDWTKLAQSRKPEELLYGHAYQDTCIRQPH
jgi:hypothetical protein